MGFLIFTRRYLSSKRITFCIATAIEMAIATATAVATAVAAAYSCAPSMLFGRHPPHQYAPVVVV